MLQNADPTGEIQPDSIELLDLEDQCYMMGPLIDQHLQKIDYKHAILDDVNLKIFDAFQMYNNLMKESITKSTNFMGANLYNPQMMGSNPSMLGTPNSINFVAAPPQTEAPSGHVLANQLKNFASSNFSNMGPNQQSSIQQNKEMNQPGPALDQTTQYQMSYANYNGAYPSFNPMSDSMNVNPSMTNNSYLSMNPATYSNDYRAQSEQGMSYPSQAMSLPIQEPKIDQMPNQHLNMMPQMMSHPGVSHFGKSS